MIRKLPDLFLALAFLFIISIPLFSPLPIQSLFWDQDCVSQSNPSIKSSIKALVDFPATFNDYFCEHHLLFQEEVDALHSARFFLLHEKSYPNVLIGKQDWLYYTGENNINDYECASFFTKRELKAIRSRLLDWNEQLEERGIHFYIVVAPNKETIYPQYLPDRIVPGEHICRIDQVMQILQPTRLSVLDLRDTMQSGTQTAQVYYRTDTHWNSTGAFLASREILTLLKQDFHDLEIPAMNDYSREKQSFSGDLADFLPADEKFVEYETVLIPRFTPSALFEDMPDRSVISHIPKSSLPSAVIFCDSFSDELQPYLSEYFSRVIYSRSFSIDLDLIDREKPDIVILEIAQRYLTLLR